MSGLSRITNGILCKTEQIVNYFLPIRVNFSEIKENINVSFQENQNINIEFSETPIINTVMQENQSINVELIENQSINVKYRRV